MKLINPHLSEYRQRKDSARALFSSIVICAMCVAAFRCLVGLG